MRHAPTDRVVAIVKRLLSAPSEHVRVTTVGAVMVLKGDELLAAMKAAAERDDLTPAGRRVFETSIQELETNPARWDRDKPFADPEDVFGVRW